MRRADVRSLSIAYERVGRGPALVLLHGFLFDSRMWRPQLDGLRRDFTVIAWDAPGAGASDDPPEPFGLGDWADCLAGLLEACEIDAAHVLGLSWGGMVAQELYRRRPDRVLTLVLADTYAGWRGSLSTELCDERLAQCLLDASAPAPDVVARYLPGMHAPSATPEVRAELARLMSDFHPEGFRLMARSSAETDARGLLPHIRVPTMLVWGEDDARSPLSVARQFHERSPARR
jgi:pimeloyl-ACP methyl ester carboxylesterase